MEKIKERKLKRIARHERIRKQMSGTPQKPRLAVHRSLNHLYAQVIDDTEGRVLLGMSTLAKVLKGKIKSGGNVQAATALGEIFAHEAQKKGIKKVCFDRGGYLYHGRVKAFADAARKAGMEF